MIEVNLFSVPSNDQSAMVGRCVSRSRFSKETAGVSVVEFVKGFLKENLDTLSTALNNNDITELLGSDQILNNKDLATLQYCLGKIGYKLTIWNVADDEENALGVPEGDVIEWNIIDHGFLQNDYPTATKLMPDHTKDIASNLRDVVDQLDLFNPDKFGNTKNPFNILLGNLEKEKEVSGRINSALVTKVYSLLSEMGIDIFHATSEN